MVLKQTFRTAAETQTLYNGFKTDVQNTAAETQTLYNGVNSVQNRTV
jgi:hypothetical protein